MSSTTEPPSMPQPLDHMRSIYEALQYSRQNGRHELVPIPVVGETTENPTPNNSGVNISTEVSLPYLMGVSGEAFRFFYSTAQPLRGMNTLFHNPLRATFKALGFKHEMRCDDTYDSAWERLRGNVSAGKPTLLPFSDSCPFITASDSPEKVICQNGSLYEMNAQQLQTMWQPASGFFELGPYGYYQLALGERERNPKERDIVLGSFRTASKLMRTRRRVHECAIGLAAYEELIGHLEYLVDCEEMFTVSEIDPVAKWGGQPLTQCLNGRKAIFEYLQLVRKHFSDEDELEQFDKAIEGYRKIVTLFEKLRYVWPTVPKQIDQPPKVHLSFSLPFLSTWRIGDKWAREQARAIKQFKPSCQLAVKRLRQILSLETISIEAIETVIRMSEKVKM